MNCSIDATNNTRLGRYINDAPIRQKECNCLPKPFYVDGVPHILIFAARDILADEELRYDYGTCNLPWRNKKQEVKKPCTKTCIESHVPSASGPVINPASDEVEKQPTSVESHVPFIATSAVKTMSERFKKQSISATVINAACPKAKKRPRNTSVRSHKPDDATTEINTTSESVKKKSISVDSNRSLAGAAMTNATAATAVDDSVQSGKPVDPPGATTTAATAAVDDSVQSGKPVDPPGATTTATAVDDSVQSGKPVDPPGATTTTTTAVDDSVQSSNPPGATTTAATAAVDDSVQSGKPDTASVDSATSTSSKPSSIVPYSSTDDSGDDDYCESKVVFPVTLDSPHHVDDDCISDGNTVISDSCSDSGSDEIPVTHRICRYMPVNSFIYPPNATASGQSSNPVDSSIHPPSVAAVDTSQSSMPDCCIDIEPDDNDEIAEVAVEDVQSSDVLAVDDEDDDNDDDDSNCSVQVAVTCNKSVRRKWDKRYFCKFCMKPQSKLPRHMTMKHMDESEVEAFVNMPLKSRRRKLLLRKLMNDGNYLHNIDVLKSNVGNIVPFKRPNASAPVSHDRYIPCEYCRAMFVRDSLWKHKKKCPFKPDTTSDDSYGHCQGRGSLLLPFSSEASDGLKNDVISVMNQDVVTAAVRMDDLIMKFGSRLHFTHGHIRHRWQYIRERIRQLGRLLLKVRKACSSVRCLMDCILPENFHVVVKCVRYLSGFDEETHTYATPSLALKIGHSLKECARIQISSCTVRGQPAQEKLKYEEFLSLCDSEWSHEISSHALRSLHQRKFSKPLVLPFAEDMKLLHNHLATIAQTSTQTLSKKPTASAWSELCQVTLTQVVIFNRRRGGEAQRMLMSAYCADSGVNVHDDIASCLSEVEHALCREFKIVYIEGKRGRKVPVLLNKAAQAQIALLIEKRSSGEISATNKFLFARRNSLEPHRSSDTLRRFAGECGAQNPCAITSTKLRKHVATMSQMLALRKHELDLLATFLGHDIKVHREFYRLPEQTLQVAKVSKLLIAMERGDSASLLGRNLDNVDVDVPGY